MPDRRIEIADVPDEGRYVLTIDGTEAGEVAYILEPGRMVVDHTEVDEAYEGQGLGGRLARHVLDDIRARGLQVVPVCAFLAAYLDRHPADQDLIADDAAQA